MVRYYDHYSNVSHDKRKKQGQDGLIPSILEPNGSSKACPPRPETGTGSGGETRLTIIGQTMYYFESDFLSIPHW
jgi:hypothetical protein